MARQPRDARLENWTGGDGLAVVPSSPSLVNTFHKFAAITAIPAKSAVCLGIGIAARESARQPWIERHQAEVQPEALGELIEDEALESHEMRSRHPLRLPRICRLPICYVVKRKHVRIQEGRGAYRIGGVAE